MNIKYNKTNLDIISKLIKDNLTLDLVSKRHHRWEYSNPMLGHCYNASACLQMVFGPDNIKLRCAKDNNKIWHWWVIDLNGNIIDLTSEQYTSIGKIPPYEKGKKPYRIALKYRKRAMTLFNRAFGELVA